jgi:hypothetical protein
MDYDEDIREPIPTYTDRLIPQDDIDKAIEESLKDYEETTDEIDMILIKSLEEFEETEKMNEELIIQSSLEELIIQSSLESFNNEKVLNFISHLKRLNGLQKNNTISKFLILLENYSNKKINEITVSKDEYKEFFDEIKNIRYTNDILDILKSIIIVSSDIDL